MYILKLGKRFLTYSKGRRFLTYSKGRRFLVKDEAKAEAFKDYSNAQTCAKYYREIMGVTLDIEHVEEPPQHNWHVMLTIRHLNGKARKEQLSFQEALTRNVVREYFFRNPEELNNSGEFRTANPPIY